MSLIHFHHWETPLYEIYLDGRVVNKKCQCGAVKYKERYVPLPDTVEYVQYKKNQRRQIAELEDENDLELNDELLDVSPTRNSVFNLGSIFVGLIALGFTIYVLGMIIPSATKAFFNVSDSIGDKQNLGATTTHMFLAILPLFFIAGTILVIIQHFIKRD